MLLRYEDGSVVYSAKDVTLMLQNDPEFRKIVVEYLEKKLLDKLNNKN